MPKKSLKKIEKNYYKTPFRT